MNWDDVLDIASLVLLVFAGALALVAGIGLLRLPDTLTRLHAATKPQILGLVFVVIAFLWIAVPLLLKMRGKAVLVADEG